MIRLVGKCRSSEWTGRGQIGRGNQWSYCTMGFPIFLRALPLHFLLTAPQPREAE